MKALLRQLKQTQPQTFYAKCLLLGFDARALFEQRGELSLLQLRSVTKLVTRLVSGQRLRFVRSSLDSLAAHGELSPLQLRLVQISSQRRLVSSLG